MFNLSQCKKWPLLLLSLIVFLVLLTATAAADNPETEKGSMPVLFFQSKTGQLKVWFMEQGSRVFSDVFAAVDPAWQVKAVVDSDGDGHADIYFYNREEGRVKVWLMEGLSRVDKVEITNPAPHRNDIDPPWDMKGVGDLNDSGEPDIIWQRDDGELAIWLMDNQEAVRTGRLFNKDPVYEDSKVNPTWQIGAITDLFGDGRPEILWQAVEGEFLDQLAYWNVNVAGADFYRSGSGRLIEGGKGRSIQAGWRMKEAVDLKGDGKPEILFQGIRGSLKGELAYWVMEAEERMGGSRLNPRNIGPQWDLVGAQVMQATKEYHIYRPGYADLPGEVKAWKNQWIYRSLDHPTGQTYEYNGQLYILAAYGECMTTGYHVEITSLAEYNNNLVCIAHFTKPGPDDVVGMLITYPYDLIVLDNPGLPVQFGATGAETEIF